MSLIDLITGNVGNQVAEDSSKKFGIDKNQIIALSAVAVPLIVGALRKNAQKSAAEADNINNALSRDHDGSILNNPTAASQQDGNSILNHILGNDRNQVEQQLASKTGIGMDKVGPILASLAPLIMGYIGKQKAQNNVSSGGGISDLLSGILSSTAGNTGTNAGGFDLGSIASAVLGNQNQNNSGGGNLLGGLLNNIFK